MRRTALTLATAALLLLGGCCFYTRPAAARPGPGHQGLTREPLVRVRLATGNDVTISSDAGLELSSGSLHQSVAGGQPVELGFSGYVTMSVGGKAPARVPDTLAVQPAGAGFVKVGKRSYRGGLLVFRSADGDLAVVNVLGLESYLFGVVPCEIGPINGLTLEAVKAQAVAARSFTLTRLGKRKGLGHDLFDSYARDQEYRGTGSETELGRRAVTATAGEVLTYQGEVCVALYHANCGGVTGNGSQPYLRSVPDTPGHRRNAKAFCSGDANFRWKVAAGKESLSAVVGRISGVKAGVRGVRLETDKASGRVKYLHFATDRGNVRVQGSDFRTGMGLKSQTFTMAIRGSSVSFDGRGWGHGSGLCQDGAIGMAESGAAYRNILRHYYSGVSLTRKY